MADRPTMPTVPTPPSRQRPSAFASEADAWVASFPAFADYLRELADYVDQRAGDAMAAAIAGDISSLDLSQFAGRAIGVDAGGTMLTGIIFQDLDKATQAIAEAGTDNDDYMTALRTRQAIDQFGSALWEHLATKEANGDANLAFQSEFDSARYIDYMFVFRNILPATDNQRFHIRPSDDGGTSKTSTRHGTPQGQGTWNTGDEVLSRNTSGSVSAVGSSGADETGFSGTLVVYDLHSDKGASAALQAALINNQGSQITSGGSWNLQRPSADGPIDQIQFQFASGNIASGQISLYGLPDRS